MSGWIMGIVGVIALATLADILLPEGETAKYIKGFLAVFVVAAIVAPIPFFLDSETAVEDFFKSTPITTDGELLEKLEDLRDKQDDKEKEARSTDITENSANIYITEKCTLESWERERGGANEGEVEKYCRKTENGQAYRAYTACGGNLYSYSGLSGREQQRRYGNSRIYAPVAEPVGGSAA